MRGSHFVYYAGKYRIAASISFAAVLTQETIFVLRKIKMDLFFFRKDGIMLRCKTL